MKFLHHINIKVLILDNIKKLKKTEKKIDLTKNKMSNNINVDIGKYFSDTKKYYFYPEINEIIDNTFENKNISAKLSYLEPYYDHEKMLPIGVTGATCAGCDFLESKKENLEKEFELLVFECNVLNSFFKDENGDDYQDIKFLLDSLYIRPSLNYNVKSYQIIQLKEFITIDMVQAVWKCDNFDTIFNLLKKNNPNLIEDDLLKIKNGDEDNDEYNPLYTIIRYYEVGNAHLCGENLINSKIIKQTKTINQNYSKLIIKTTISDISRNKKYIIKLLNLIPNI